MPKYSALALLVILGLSASAHAADAKSAPAGSRWHSIIDQLQAEGVHAIGAFDVDQFRQDAGSISWLSLKGAPAAVLSGARKSAFYLSGQKKVYLSDHQPAEALASLPQLELHEALGANGYNDRDYALSTALSTVASRPSASERDSLVNAYGSTLFRQMSFLQGGSGVSGGGDLATLFVKDQVLKLIFAMGKPLTTDFLVNYPMIDFEPLAQSPHRGVVVQYVYSPKANSHGKTESFSLFIPMERWKSGASSRANLIREAARKVLEIFSAYQGQSTTSFVPSNCGGSQKVTYPTTKDAAVRSIQDVHGAAQLGCLKPDALDDGGRTIIAPALSVEQEPEQSGNYYFDCKLSYEGKVEASRPSSTAGLRMQLNESWSIVPGDNLYGVLYVDTDGKILASWIRFHAPGDTSLSLPHMDRAKDAEHAQSQINVNGHALTFTCEKADAK